MEESADPRGTHKFFARFQVIVVYGLIECALWTPGMTVRNRWALAAALATVLFLFLDRPSVRRLGLGLPATAAAGTVLVLSIAAAGGLVSLALRLGGAGEAHLTLPYLYGWGAYLIWALLQQFLLQSFFFTRCEELFGDSVAVWTAATLFAAAHLPSLILTTLTLAGGLFFCAMFRFYRSIYPIAILHAALGLTVGAVLPDSLLHHMRTGIGYLNY